MIWNENWADTLVAGFGLALFQRDPLWLAETVIQWALNWYHLYAFFQIIKTLTAEPKVAGTPQVETSESLPKKQNYNQLKWTNCPDCDETFSSRALHKLHICLGKFFPSDSSPTIASIVGEIQWFGISWGRRPLPVRDYVVSIEDGPKLWNHVWKVWRLLVWRN